MLRDFAAGVAVLVFFASTRPALGQETDSVEPGATAAPAESSSAPRVSAVRSEGVSNEGKKSEKARLARVPVFVEDVHQLAELTREDSTIFPAAQLLAERSHAAWTYGTLGLALGIGLMVLGGTDWASDGWGRRSGGLFVSGGALLLASTAFIWSVLPERADRLDVMNAWNLRHPDRPIFP